MYPLVVYGPDDKTPIDPRSLPMADYRDVMDFFEWAKGSVLFREGPPRQVVPEWARPIPARPVHGPVNAPVSVDTQPTMFDLEERPTKSKSRRKR
jgi:hypothetical protein